MFIISMNFIYRLPISPGYLVTKQYRVPPNNIYMFTVSKKYKQVRGGDNSINL